MFTLAIIIVVVVILACIAGGIAMASSKDACPWTTWQASNLVNAGFEIAIAILKSVGNG